MYQNKRTPVDLAVEDKKEALLRLYLGAINALFRLY